MAKKAHSSKRSAKRRPIINVKADYDLHSAAISSFRKSISLFADSGVLDPLSYRLLQQVTSHALIPSTLLAVTLLRYSELTQTTPRALFQKKPVEVVQLKTKTKRRVSLYNLRDCMPLQTKELPTFLTTIGYDRLCRYIKLARSRAHISLPRPGFDETHIFRHLNASWLSHCGVPNEEISKRLGHASSSAVLSYIHPYAALGRMRQL